MERGCRELISPCNRPILLLYSPARTGILFATRRIKGPAQRVVPSTRRGRGDRWFVNEVTFSRNEPQHARLPTKRVSGATQFTQLARFSSHYWPANSLRLFSSFSPRNFWPTLVPTLTERVTATRNFAAVSLAIVTRDEC